ncbi:MAG TPA: PAS domain-containing protein [Gemmatimonadales bacterium]|nr:PAS domain-containing protein [Gemmatimonadales bacterium]
MSPHRFADITQLAQEFFELAPIGMAILRLEEPENPASLRILALNPASTLASDVPTAAVGKRLDKDFPAIANTPFPAQLAEVMRSGRAANLGEGPGTYDRSRHFTLTAFPIPPDCVGLVFEDVTERRQQQRRAHESEIRYRKIFEASSAAICMFHAKDGTLIDANPRFVEMLGLGSSAQLIGKKLESFGFWADGNDEYGKLLAQLRQQRSIREATVTFHTFGGQVRRALVALELFAVEGQDYVLGIFWRV